MSPLLELPLVARFFLHRSEIPKLVICLTINVSFATIKQEENAMKIILLKFFYTFALLTLNVLLTGCPETIPPKTIDELLAAPEEVYIDGQNYSLSTYLWRDFMPPSTGSALMAVITVSERNALAIPANINVVHLWVINVDEVWSTVFSDEVHPAPPVGQLEKIARDGPMWDTGINVDVVVQIIDGTGAEYLLKAPAQLIQSTS